VTSSQWDLEVLATELRRHSGDLSLYAGFLLTTLSSALPAEMVQVERRGRLLGRLRGAEAPVVAVTVRLGDLGFTLRRDAIGKAAAASVRHESGGIALRTDTVGLDEWSRRLATALGAYAQQNAAAAEALSRFTLPGPT
jgi:hypothetical protein